MERVEKITIADGTNLEVKHEDGMLGKPDVKRVFRKIVAATKVNKTRSFAFLNEPYLWLKHKMLDLHAFISSYVESKSSFK